MASHSVLLTLRWPLASAAAVVPLLGCGPGDVEQSFRVIDFDYDGATTLTLTFSEPVANADAIDPNDFRISLGRTFRVNYTDPESGEAYMEQSTFYSDIGGFYYYDDQTDLQRFAFAAASAGAANNQLLLLDPDQVIAQACMFVTQYLQYYQQYSYPGLERDIGLFLHYASGDIPLESENGGQLADIAPEWVTTQENDLMRESYGFIHLNPQLRIPCP